MYPAITEVVAQAGFVLALRFDSGERRWLDMNPLLDFGRFRELRDPARFRQVRVSFDAIEWACGLDLDPEFAYARSSAAPPSSASADRP